MNYLVKFFYDDDGSKVVCDHWHLVDPCNPEGPAKLCTREFFGYGESSVKYEEKESVRGGITCEKCISAIREYKKVKL